MEHVSQDLKPRLILKFSKLYTDPWAPFMSQKQSPGVSVLEFSLNKTLCMTGDDDQATQAVFDHLVFIS